MIPQDRPHDEQRATAAVIAEAGLAVVCREWPAADAWPALLAAATRLRRWRLGRVGATALRTAAGGGAAGRAGRGAGARVRTAV